MCSSDLLLPASSGTCKVADRAIAAWSRADLARCVAYLPQGGDVAWSLSVRDVVLLGRLPFGGSLGRPHAADREKAIRALQRADAAAFVARRVDKLSAGERACVLLARALATEADILLADEPAAHLDPAHQLRLMQTLREEARRGSAVVVTLHELALAARYCDRLLVLDNGRVAASGTPEIGRAHV